MLFYVLEITKPLRDDRSAILNEVNITSIWRTMGTRQWIKNNVNKADHS